LKKVKALVIEDSITDADLLRRDLSLCEKVRFELLFAEDLQHALMCLKKQQFDVILLDLSLPDCVGIRTFSEVKTEAGNAPVVILTGTDDDLLAAEALQNGAQDYIVKGNFSPELIGRSVTYAIERRAQEIKIRETEEKWKAFSEASEDNYMLWDAALYLSAANGIAAKVYERLCGRQLEIGRHMLDLMQNLKNTERYSAYREVLRTGIPFSVPEYPMKLETGEVRYYTVKAFKVGSGLGVITSDVTELKRSEIILKKSYERLREIDEIKSNFITIASHELKTPLSIIKGFNAFLLKEAMGPLNAAQKDMAGQIEKSSVRMERIINDMLDISRIESGSLSIVKQKADLAALINEAADSMRFIAQEHGVKIVPELKAEKAPVEMDKVRILQVITNLLNNSVKFSAKNSEVIITLSVAGEENLAASLKLKKKQGERYYLICVKDSGEGIERGNLNKIFEGFFQAESPDVRKNQGAGLGLKVAKSIVMAHGGDIHAESEGKGKGTAICVILPSGLAD